MIGLSTPIYDLDGARYFKRGQLDLRYLNESQRWTRRATRVPTLDGGAAVYDTGYAPADRTMTIRVPGASQDIIDYLSYLARNYPLIIISTRESVFTGIPFDAWVDAEGAAALTINITEQTGE